MEDFHGEAHLESDAGVTRAYAVFDGHAGSSCAAAMSGALPEAVLAEYARNPGEPEQALGANSTCLRILGASALYK